MKKNFSTLALSLCITSPLVFAKQAIDPLSYLEQAAQPALFQKILNTTPVSIQQSVRADKMLNKSSHGTPVTTSAITPVCPTLAVNTVYPLGGSQTGDVLCYHFAVTQNSKTSAFLVGQSAATNVNLTIIRHNPDDTFTALAASANGANQDELAVALTEPGDYYWYMEVISSDAADFSFGAIVSTQLDAYEFNDDVAHVTILPDKQNTISANIDNIFDFDYYVFQSVRGQDLLLELQDKNNSDEFVLEVYNGGSWITIPANSRQPIKQLQPNQNVLVRVSGNPNLAANPANYYGLTFGSIVASFSANLVSGESGVERIPYSAFSNPYLTTQAYKKLTWRVTLQDSTGQPVAGAKAKFRLIRDFENIADMQHPYEDFDVLSNNIGVASGTIDLGSCFSDLTVEHTSYSLGYRNVWRSDFRVGAWRLELDTYPGQELGIGGDSVPFVYLGHICDQDLVSSTKQ
ncbi:hypothetical protein ACFOEE_00380 [Pseudoalteromonas fenneropenaei]|uniref:Uncharacterized protein n=1 Tax=Pseudoalteromonas fenneropenaei TaxID=1737459 RepID=A0ABV7CER8_9GAMM